MIKRPPTHAVVPPLHSLSLSLWAYPELFFLLCAIFRHHILLRCGSLVATFLPQRYPDRLARLSFTPRKVLGPRLCPYKDLRPPSLAHSTPPHPSTPPPTFFLQNGSCCFARLGRQVGELQGSQGPRGAHGQVDRLHRPGRDQRCCQRHRHLHQRRHRGGRCAHKVCASAFASASAPPPRHHAPPPWPKTDQTCPGPSTC